MKEVYLSLVNLIIPFVLLGCATNLQYTDRDIYKIEIAPNQRTRIHTVLINEENGNLFVSGYIRLINSAMSHPPDYIKIDFINESGEIIQSEKVEYFPRNLRRSDRVYEGKFSATFNDAPPAGTKIRFTKVK